MNIVSETAFQWIVTAMTAGLAGTWFVYDAISLARLRGKNREDPVAGDKRFGYVMGIIIGFVGVWGCLRFHGVV